MGPLGVLRATFPTLDLGTARLYRVLVGGRWRTIPAHDDTDALRAAQAAGAVTTMEDITRCT